MGRSDEFYSSSMIFPKTDGLHSKRPFSRKTRISRDRSRLRGVKQIWDFHKHSRDIVKNHHGNRNFNSECSAIAKGIMRNAVHELRDNADTNGVVDSDIDVLIVLMVPGRKVDIIH